MHKNPLQTAGIKETPRTSLEVRADSCPPPRQKNPKSVHPPLVKKSVYLYFHSTTPAVREAA